MKQFRSLKFKLPFIMSVFVIVVALMNLVLFNTTIKKHVLKDALDKNMVISNMLTNKLEIYLMDIFQIVNSAAINCGEYDEVDGIYNEINILRHNYNYFDQNFYVDKSGVVIYSNPWPKLEGAINYDASDREYYKNSVNNRRTVISGLYLSENLKVPHFTIASPVIKSSGNVNGVIAGSVPLRNVSEIIHKNLDEFNGRIIVLDHNGSYIMDSKKDYGNEIVMTKDFDIFFDDIHYKLTDAIEDKISGIGKYETNGEIYYGAISYIDDLGWTIVVEQSEKTVLSKVNSVISGSIFLLIGLLIVALLIGVFFASKITRPLAEFIELIRGIRKGQKITEEYEHFGDNEVGELYCAFYDMAKKLDLQFRELEESVKRGNNLQIYLNNIFDSVGCGIIVLDQDENITMFNETMSEITGYASEEYVGENYLYLNGKLELDPLGTIGKSLKDGEDVKNISGTLVNKKEEIIQVNTTATILKDIQDNTIGYVYLISDVSEIKALEEHINREDRINIVGELASSMIHDVGNPLAGIENLLEIYELEEEPNSIHRREIIKLIKKEIKKLNELVINNLSFLRSNIDKSNKSDIRLIIDDVINIIKFEMISKDIVLERKYTANKPEVAVNDRAVKQAFINILKNAIHAVDGNNKYIEIFVKDCEKYVEVIIKDYGVGIPPENINNIFEPFYTTKNDGTGLGLSIAYKIIRENKGEIKVNSKVGEGTEFIIRFEV